MFFGGGVLENLNGEVVDKFDVGLLALLFIIAELLAAGEERENVGGAVRGMESWLSARATQVFPE